MGDERLMLAARAAGYSMIPQQEVCDGQPEAETVREAVRAKTQTVAEHLRSWLLQVTAGLSATNVRGTLTNWLHSRAHA